MAALVLVGDYAAPVGGSCLLGTRATVGTDLLLVMVSSGAIIAQVVIVLGGGGFGGHGAVHHGALLCVSLVEARDHLQAVSSLDEAVRRGTLLDHLGGRGMFQQRAALNVARLLLVIVSGSSLLVEKAGVLLLRGVLLWWWWVEVGTPRASLLLGSRRCGDHASTVLAGVGRVVVVGMPLLGAGLMLPAAAVSGA